MTVPLEAPSKYDLLLVQSEGDVIKGPGSVII